MCAVSSRSPAPERGSALVLALLVTALAATLGVSMAESFAVSAARVENRLHGVQAQQYLLGTEELATLVLEQDAANSATDHLLESWAQPLPPLATDEGWLEIGLEDAQGRFNLNGLVQKTTSANDTGLPPGQRFTPTQQRFIRLLQTFDDYPVTQADAVAITEAVIDWIDADDEPLGFGGAESLYYAGGPWLASNRLFTSVSELRLVRHVTPELLQRLQPLLVALPEATSLNLNTVLPQLLRTLNASGNLAPLGTQDVQGLLQQRQSSIYETAEDFFASPAMQALAPGIAADGGCGVASDYFIVRAVANFNGGRRQLESLIHRTPERTLTISRRPGGWM